MLFTSYDMEIISHISSQQYLLQEQLNERR